MVLTVYLYNRQDIDLLTLLQKRENKLSTMIKESLRAFALEDSYSIKIPENATYNEPTKKKNKKSRSLASKKLTIYLNESSDDDIIELMNNVKEGYKSSFIKQVVRCYMERPFLDAYCKTPINNEVKPNPQPIQPKETSRKSTPHKKEVKATIEVEQDSNENSNAESIDEFDLASAIDAL